MTRDCSVTRFGVISPLWQNFKTLWQSLEGLFSICQNCKPILTNISSKWQSFIVVNGQKLKKNNLAIWSHCSRVESLGQSAATNFLLIGMQMRFVWSICCEKDELGSHQSLVRPDLWHMGRTTFYRMINSSKLSRTATVQNCENNLGLYLVIIA